MKIVKTICMVVILVAVASIGVIAGSDVANNEEL